MVVKRSVILLCELEVLSFNSDSILPNCYISCLTIRGLAAEDALLGIGRLYLGGAFLRLVLGLYFDGVSI